MAGYSPWGRKESNTTDHSHTHTNTHRQTACGISSQAKDPTLVPRIGSTETTAGLPRKPLPTMFLTVMSSHAYLNVCLPTLYIILSKSFCLLDRCQKMLSHPI